MLKIWGVNFGSIPGAGPPPKKERGEFFSHADEYADFSLLRVLLGYGLPTLAAVGLATLVFSLRDL